MWHLKAHYKHQVSVSTDSLSKIQGRLLNCKGFFEGYQWQNARLPPRCDLSPLKTENGVERIRRCDLLWKPRTISIVCAFLLFLHLPCRDKRAQHAGNCDGNYNPADYPLLSHKWEILVLLLGPVITLVISIVCHSQAFAVDPTVDKNKISDKARDVAFQQDLVSKHHLLFVDNNSVGG